MNINEALDKYLNNNNYSSLDLKAVLFDMDGVLFDSMKWHAKSWKKVMDEYNIPSTEEEFYLYEGMVGFATIRHLIERDGKIKPTESIIDEIYQKKSKYFAKMNDGALIPFAKDIVTLVNDNGLKSVLVTGSGQHTLFQKLEESFPKMFPKNQMVTAYDVKHGKPHPEPYLMGLEKGGNLKPNQAIVVENAPRGVEAAAAAGIFTVAINTGPIDPQILNDCGANIVYPDMKSFYNDFPLILNASEK